MKRFALSEWISVDRTVSRSVNLERDAEDRRLLERFQVTPTACDVLLRLADAFDGEKANGLVAHRSPMEQGKAPSATI